MTGRVPVIHELLFSNRLQNKTQTPGLIPGSSPGTGATRGGIGGMRPARSIPSETAEPIRPGLVFRARRYTLVSDETGIASRIAA